MKAWRADGILNSHRLPFPHKVEVERFKDLLKRFPERIIMRVRCFCCAGRACHSCCLGIQAVWGFMPKTKTNRRIFRACLAT